MPSGDNFPLSMWSNRWSTMPVHGLEDAVRLPPPDRRARLDFMPGSDVPVIRQPFEPGDRLPFWVGRNAVDAHFLFDLDDDPDENENLVGCRGASRTWWSCCATPWGPSMRRVSSSSGLGIA